MEKVDRFEEYDIRINKNYTSLLLSELPDVRASKDHTKALPIKRLKVMPTNDYLRKYSDSMSQSPTILPAGCRYVEPLTNGDQIYVIEQQSQFRTVAMSLGFTLMHEQLKARNLLDEYGIRDFLTKERKELSGGSTYYKVNLAFPYVIFCIYVNKSYQVQVGYSFLRINPMLGLSDYLLKMPLSNISDNQTICFGSRLNNKQYETAAEAVNATIDVFWTSVFNLDYTYNISAYKEVSGISNFLEWQHLSKVDPMFIYRVDWIKYKHNIFNLIEDIKNYMGAKNKSMTGSAVYDNFVKTFTSPVKIAEVTTGKIRKKIEGVYYDIANGYYISEILRLEVGDSFKNEKGSKEYHIISFIGIRGENPNIIRMSYNKKLFNFKLTKKSIIYLRKRVEADRYLPTFKVNKKLELKADDIITYKNNIGAKVYKRVFYIRKSIDDKPEIKLGGEYYIARNLPKEIQLFNQQKPVIYDMNLKKGSEYLYSPHTIGGAIFHQIEKCKYDGIDVGSNNNLMYVFKSINQHRDVSIPMNEPSKEGHKRRLFPPLKKSSLCKNAEVISAGRSLKRFVDHSTEKSAKVYKGSSGYMYNVNVAMENVEGVNIKNLIKKETMFQVDTHLGFIEFKIGDLVVVANWKDPLSVLNIKRIEGFKVEDKESFTELSFILVDKSGKLSTEPFVSNDVIRTGYIRKITTKFEDLSSGTKIIATKGNISNFPKKDINIVIGIIIDGPNPLILCSNGCTLWYQDLIDNFELIKMDSDEWKAKDHVQLDPKKIKFQAGDIVIPSYADSVREQGYLMIQIRSSRSLKYHPLSYYTTSMENFHADKSFQDECVLDCIPNPRIGKAKQDKDGYVPANTNFHGGMEPVDQAAFLYVNDPRSLIYV
jgi:hypothetical protein